MRRTIVSLVLLAALAPAALAQMGVATVDPGMSKAEVIQALGSPAAERSAGDFTYLFFQNGCERECGMSDLVTLERDSVVDAIFRASWRRYSGVSSSPVPRRPVAAAAARSARSQPARTTPAGQARDVDISALFGEPTAAGAEAPPAAAQAQPAAAPGLDLSTLFDDPTTIRAQPAAAVAPAPAAPPNRVDLASLFDEPVPAAAPQAPAAVQTVPDPDTIKEPARDATAAERQGRDAAWSSWPPPRTTATPVPAVAAEPAPARVDSSRAPAAAGGPNWSSWPPPREKPAADSTKAAPRAQTEAKPEKTEKKKDEPRGAGWSTWPPPRERPPE
ncbi:MAG TPA: hypothetical protein VMM18_09760 [Gemmatimonadaceae bacterium]|nr:hypothetical protein [Gemmatimonadaceae bacterium]